MLVLTRKEGESLVLKTSNGPVEVRMLKCMGNRTRVGLEAPPEVTILRSEILANRTEVDEDAA